MRDKLGHPIHPGDLVTWAVAQMQNGSLRFGNVSHFEEPGVVFINKHRSNPQDKKVVIRQHNEIVVVPNPKE